jgi:hypothetical protein
VLQGPGGPAPTRGVGAPVLGVSEAIRRPWRAVCRQDQICESWDLTHRTVSDGVMRSGLFCELLNSGMVALSLGWTGGQAPQPHSGAPEAQGLTARTSPKRILKRRDASRADSVSRMKSRILQIIAQRFRLLGSFSA